MRSQGGKRRTEKCCFVVLGFLLFVCFFKLHWEAFEILVSGPVIEPEPPGGESLES